MDQYTFDLYFGILFPLIFIVFGFMAGPYVSYLLRRQRKNVSWHVQYEVFGSSAPVIFWIMLVMSTVTAVLAWVQRPFYTFLHDPAPLGLTPLALRYCPLILVGSAIATHLLLKYWGKMRRWTYPSTYYSKIVQTLYGHLEVG